MHAKAPSFMCSHLKTQEVVLLTLGLFCWSKWFDCSGAKKENIGVAISQRLSLSIVDTGTEKNFGCSHTEGYNALAKVVTV